MEIKEHPISSLKRDLEILKSKVSDLEGNNDVQARVYDVMVEKYNEMKDLMERSLTLFQKREQYWENRLREVELQIKK